MLVNTVNTGFHGNDVIAGKSSAVAFGGFPEENSSVTACKIRPAPKTPMLIMIMRGNVIARGSLIKDRLAYSATDPAITTSPQMISCFFIKHFP
jgi:hypothetical protein